jgi:hypothetical protein
MNTAVDESESEIAVWGNGYYYCMCLVFRDERGEGKRGIEMLMYFHSPRDMSHRMDFSMFSLNTCMGIRDEYLQCNHCCDVLSFVRLLPLQLSTPSSPL